MVDCLPNHDLVMRKRWTFSCFGFNFGKYWGLYRTKLWSGSSEQYSFTAQRTGTVPNRLCSCHLTINHLPYSYVCHTLLVWFPISSSHCKRSGIQLCCWPCAVSWTLYIPTDFVFVPLAFTIDCARSSRLLLVIGKPHSRANVLNIHLLQGVLSETSSCIRNSVPGNYGLETHDDRWGCLLNKMVKFDVVGVVVDHAARSLCSWMSLHLSHNFPWPTGTELLSGAFADRVLDLLTHFLANT